MQAMLILAVKPERKRQPGRIYADGKIILKWCAMCYVQVRHDGGRSGLLWTR